MRRVYLGVDCGTQSTKVVLRDPTSGEVLAVGRAPHELIERDDGTREQDPRWWIKALGTAVRDAVRDERFAIAGIGVSGQQHGLVCLDESDRPVRAAKLWNDTTTARECEALTRRIGGEARVMELTGNLMLPGYTAPKIAWLAAHEPDAYARTVRMCLPHDYLNLWLTGRFVTEAGDASGTAYFDVRALRYSDAVLAAIDERRDWDRTLPAIAPSLSIVGRLREDAATSLGLEPGIPVSAGGGDNMCAAIGCGVVSEGPVAVSLGTSGTVFAYRGEPAVDAAGEAAAFCDSTGGWLPLAATLNCTSATEWIRELFAMDHATVDAAVAAGHAYGLAFLPYLAGERTPNRPQGTGVFVGLRSSHGRDAIVRAVIEGVTFGLAYAMHALRRAGVAATEITLIGGGSASDAWAQLCADIFELPVVRPAIVEAAASGAARQAQWALEGKRAELARVPTRRFEPRPGPELREAAERMAALREIARTNRL
ncbi:MAG TPA: xylulokinase [Candidatus Limnocylindria bacterium]|nr:xylulokinase [Candidatus Limnocylindria bacterium]